MHVVTVADLGFLEGGGGPGHRNQMTQPSV